MTISILELETERLLLRQWREQDFNAFADMGEDPRVMEFFPATLTRTESHAFAQRLRSLIESRGWGLWAVEVKEGTPFIGFVGLHVPPEDLPYSPCVEIGWRLSQQGWGQGFASEAGKAVVRAAFTQIELEEILSWTATTNLRSEAVMRRIGLKDVGDRFDHPRIPEGHPLRPHIVYRLTRAEWLESNASS